MASKTIRITPEAYEILEARKKPGESFTDVVLRLAGARPLSELAGLLSEGEAQELEGNIRKGQDRAVERRGCDVSRGYAMIASS